MSPYLASIGLPRASPRRSDDQRAPSPLEPGRAPAYAAGSTIVRGQWPVKSLPGAHRVDLTRAGLPDTPRPSELSHRGAGQEPGGRAVRGLDKNLLAAGHRCPFTFRRGLACAPRPPSAAGNDGGYAHYCASGQGSGRWPRKRGWVPLMVQSMHTLARSRPGALGPRRLAEPRGHGSGARGRSCRPTDRLSRRPGDERGS